MKNCRGLQVILGKVRHTHATSPRTMPGSDRYSEDSHVGTWHDKENDKGVFDVVRVVADRSAAIKVGIANEQQCIRRWYGRPKLWIGG